jgi:hypothetical protein
MANTWAEQSTGERIKNVATLTGILVGGAGAVAALEHGSRALERRLDGSAPAKRKQVAPRYNDKALSPRSKVAKLKAAGADPSRAERAAKMVSTKVAKGQLKPFIAPRVAGKFATKGAVRMVVAGRVLGTASRALGVASGVAVAGAAGLVVYNMITGKHAASDKKEVQARENDPGRILVSGGASYVAGGVAARLTAGIAAAGTFGTVAARAFPLGTAAIAGYGAYKGYAEDGARGAIRGAVNSLTFGYGGKLVDKTLGEAPPKPNPVESWIGWGVNRSMDLGRKITGAGKQSDAGRSPGFEGANKKFAATKSEKLASATFVRDRRDHRTGKEIREIVRKPRTAAGKPIGVA